MTRATDNGAVSIVMVSYHTGPALWLAIDSALEQPECRELIIVNNGNIPAVETRLQAMAAEESRFRLVTGQGNVGFAKGCNLGARSSGGEILLLLNPDSMLPQGGLARALKAFRRFPDDTLAGCLLVNPDGSEQRGCRRSILTARNAIAESLGLRRFAPGKEALNLHGTPLPEQAHEVPAVSGAFMMLSRSFYDRLHGLDEGYFLHMEDMDLCARVHKAGGRVICMPEIRVIHFRSTSEAASAVVERHKTRGFIRYLKIHSGNQYSPFALNCLAAGIWLRYALKLALSKIDRFFVSPLAAKREVARLVLLYRLTRFGKRDNSLAGKTVLVTGGSGQTGLCVVGEALARGARVVAIFHRNAIAFTYPNLEWKQCDLSKGSLDVKADVLIHTTGLWLLPDLLPGIIQAGVRRVIAFGSTSMFAKIRSGSAYEQAIVKKLQDAETRVVAIASEHKAPLTLLRPTMVYGVGLDANLSRIADAVRRFGIIPVYGKASGMRHPVQATDLANAALDVIGNPVTFDKAYNLGGGTALDYRTMVTRVFEYLGKRPRVVSVSFLPLMLKWLGKIYQMDYINGEIALRMNQDLLFPFKEAIDDFGYRPKAFLEGEVTI